MGRPSAGHARRAVLAAQQARGLASGTAAVGRPIRLSTRSTRLLPITAAEQFLPPGKLPNSQNSLLARAESTQIAKRPGSRTRDLMSHSLMDEPAG